MDKNLIKNAKSYVFKLLQYNEHRRPSILCKDSCSEISRLLAIWFRKQLPKADIYIVKGNIKNLFHDLLVVKIDNEVYIFDPTVWQFFKNKKSILMGKTTNIGRALKITAEIYGGKWKVSEQVTDYVKKEIRELKSIVAKQIK